ncbi:hypothetical protein PC120_g15717 [Phytophthora cactorum]|nr:hypothetical protein PC120_g15717 [Phytophthora cactorum]
MNKHVPNYLDKTRQTTERSPLPSATLPSSNAPARCAPLVPRQLFSRSRCLLADVTPRAFDQRARVS